MANGANSVPEKLRPEVGAPTGRVVRWVVFSVGGATRGEWRQLGARKASPRVGPPTKRAVRWVLFSCGRRALAANGANSMLKKLRPEVGPPTKRGVRWMLFSMGGATRGEWRQLGARKASPRGRGSYKGGACAGWCFLWEARPAANGASSVPEKLRPEVGAPTKAGRALGAVSCGRRDPRRMAPTRCLKSFVPRSGLLQSGPCARCCFL